MSDQILIYEGKTKNVFKNNDGTYTLKLKDDATGKDGVFDPGENAVGLSIKGLGLASLRLTKYYFEKLIAAGIPTHYLDCDLEEVSMRVKPATVFGGGVEFVCRLVADGSFIRRYGAYAKFGDKLDYLVEATLKDDERKDPPITKETLAALGIITQAEYAICEEYTKKIAKLIADDLAKDSFTLHDMKLEFGKDNNGQIMLMDEISGGCMRVYKDGVFVEPMDIELKAL